MTNNWRYNNGILFFISVWLIYASCTTPAEERLNGVWLLSHDEIVGEQVVPFYFCFNGDSLTVFDDHYFGYKGKYKLETKELTLNIGDSLLFNFPFELNSDTTFHLSQKCFVRRDDLEFHLPASYALIQFPAINPYKARSNESVVHLIKIEGKIQIIINDRERNPVAISAFVSSSHSPPQDIALYIGKGVTMRDLLEAYYYLYLGMVRNIKLITYNEGIGKFYYIREKLIVCDTSDQGLNIVPQSPTCMKSTENEETELPLIMVNDFMDVEKVRNLDDSVSVEVNIGSKLNILTYLELRKTLEEKPKAKLILRNFRCTPP